jgi:hypothetical protein
MAQTIADQGWRLASYSPSSVTFDEDRFAVRSNLPGGYIQDAIHSGHIADSQRIISPNKQDTVYVKPGYPAYSRSEAVKAPERVRNELMGVVDDYNKISFHKEGGKINKCQGGWQALVDDSPEAEVKRAAIQAAQGTIESDDRSAARRAYDRVATAYRNSDFANSAPAEVLAMMTPYGMVHYSMGDRDNGADQVSAAMSLPIFGALGTIGKAGKAVAKPAKRIVSSPSPNWQEVSDMLKYLGVKTKYTKPNLVKKYIREKPIPFVFEYTESTPSYREVDQWRRYILNNK